MMKMLSVLAGALLGAVALFAFTTLFHWLFFRPAMADGQYGMVPFITVPIGMVLGALTGFIVAQLSRRRTGTAGRVALFGSGFLTALFLLLGLTVFSGTENPGLMMRLGTTLFWFGLPLIWSGLLIVTGRRLLAGK